MGDPGGIGPEIVVASLANQWADTRCRFVVFGCAATLKDTARAIGVAPAWKRSLDRADKPGGIIVIEPSSDGTSLGNSPAEFKAQPTKEGGDLSFTWVSAAIDAALLPPDDPNHAHAVVTAPISKEAWAMAGHTQYPGHTELFADRCQSQRFAMMFDSPTLRVILVTTHIPLMEVTKHLSTNRILETIELGAQACQILGIEQPRVAVLGLNPHAGENGLLGKEDQRLIIPAIDIAKQRGINATGPHPADTLFGAATSGKHDLVVAMYHDQGLIPVKLLHRDAAVNMTVGLPIIRTSPDHGTAYDIAGSGLANPGSMRASLRLAIQMAQNTALTHSAS